MKRKHGIFFGFAVLLMTAIFTLVGCDNSTSPTNQVHSLDGSRYERLFEEGELVIVEFKDGQYLFSEKMGDGPEEGFQKGPYFVEGDTLYMLLTYERERDENYELLDNWLEPNPRRWGLQELKDSGNTITLGSASYRYDVYKVR
jgi:hypothetical protein